MPYIPPANRPPIDAKVQALAEKIAKDMIAAQATAEVSSYYRWAFMTIAKQIDDIERGRAIAPQTEAEQLAATIVDTAKCYNLQGGWTGELNYAMTMLIQHVPYEMYRRKAWEEPLRYWIYAETVGALTRTAYELHASMANDYIGNGLAGVFEDIKDEYKRRVNSAYEAAQITKSGDCFDYTTFRTQLVPVTVEGVSGFQEVMLPRQEPKP